MSAPRYSFLIPAHNEGEGIARCVASVRRFAPTDGAHEIIVVNNRSTDDTGARAAEAGARVLPSTATTIAAVRNEGVAAASGEVLVFLDGDCHLTGAWQQTVPEALDAVRAGHCVCAGAQVYPPREPRTLLWEHWFRPFALQPDASHIGSAHLICTREGFDAIGGFDARLETGEDYDFCARMLAAGGRLINDPRLVVEHHGFPATIGAFMRRERWHGRGDAGSIGAIVRSKVALMSLAFVGALVVALVLAFVSPAVAGVMLAVAAALPMLAATAKFRHSGLVTWVIASGLFVPYFLGRFMAIVDGVRPRA